MQTRADLEYRITEKLRTLSAVALQWLSEDIALIRDPKRYKNLHGHGRNAEAQTTKGWPDAYVIKSDGTVDGVEATRDRQTWTQHLEADIKKALNPDYPNLNGYLFVAGYPDHEPTPAELGQWKSQLCGLGISEDRVDLLVGKGLVAELLKPQYARTLQSILGLSPSPEYFNIISQERLPNNVERPFEPKVTEYQNGVVHRPSLAAAVEHRLRDEGCALVRGRGAAGKTVLAYLIASGGDYRPLPSYYLDLAPWAGKVEYLRGSIDNIFVEFGGHGVLFVLDNIHLEEGFAFDVFQGWRTLARPQGTRLLLLGREVRRRLGSSFDQAEIQSFTLRAGIDDLRGVFQRLARREASPESDLPNPDDTALRSWLKTFGGDPERPDSSADLMAFSAAVRNRMRYLIQGDWELNVQHARDEVRKEYLARLETSERKNLLRLAALPDDCFLPSDALFAPDTGFDVCIKKGLVFETEHGADKYIQYSLAHSSLGRLLITAASLAFDRRTECVEVASLSPFAGLTIARRAAAEGDQDLSRSVLLALARNPDWPKGMGLQFMRTNLELAKRLGVKVLPVEGAAPGSVCEVLADCARKTDLHFLVNFLTYASSKESGLSEIREAVVADLVQNPEELIDRALNTSLGDLVTFLTYTNRKENGLSDLRIGVVAKLIQNPKQLADRARKTDLQFLATFLTYASSKESGLSKLREAVVAELARSPKDLAERAQTTPLGDLVALLIYASSEESGLSKLRDAVVAELVQNPKELATRACEAPLEQLVTFLTYIQSNNLSADHHPAEKICNLIDLEAWNRRRDLEKPQQPHFALNVHKLFQSLGRPELVMAVARAQVRAANVKAWHAPGIGIHHLSSMLQSAVGVKRNDLRLFLDRVVMQEWLDLQYAEASSSGLAGSLFGIATSLPADYHCRFDVPSLRTRLNRDVKLANVGNPKNWDIVVCFIGSASLLGVATSLCCDLEWNEQLLTEIFGSHRPVEKIHSQFWSGLREVVRQHSKPCRVPAEEGELVLSAWRKLQPRTPFMASFNRSMIAWLEGCQTAGWVLNRCARPLREDIFEQIVTE
jgi:hypothetical protein